MRAFLYYILFFSILFLFKAGRCFAQSQLTSSKGIQDLVKVARKFEISPMRKPSWAENLDKPLFKVAWISDMHIHDARTIDMAKIALNQIRDELKVDFTLITGDNCGYKANLPPEDAKKPPTIQRHLWFKRFLESELGRRYAVIPGDNWPWDFDKVFGTQKRSFDFGGFHFLLTATDIGSAKKDTAAIFKEDTKQWMEQDLAANQGKPSLFIMHESIVPPSFIDAEWTVSMLNRHPNVFASLCGHLHLDLEFQRRGWKQICCPAIGPSHRPAFKVMYFFPEQIVLESYELKVEMKKYVQAPKWQRLVVPEQYHEALRTQSPSLEFTNESLTPARRKLQDEGLTARTAEVEVALSRFIVSFGLSKFGLRP